MNPPEFRSERDRLREAREQGWRSGVVVGIAGTILARAIIDLIRWLS